MKKGRHLNDDDVRRRVERLEVLPRPVATCRSMIELLDVMPPTFSDRIIAGSAFVCAERRLEYGSVKASVLRVHRLLGPTHALRQRD